MPTAKIIGIIAVKIMNTIIGFLIFLFTILTPFNYYYL